MKCNKCGYELDDDDLYCPECGEKVFSNNPYDEKVLKYKPRSNAKAIVGIVGFSISIMAIVMFYFPYVGLVMGGISLILSIIGITSWRMKGFGIAGTVVSVFAILLCLLTTYLYISVNNRNGGNRVKNTPERKAAKVLQVAKACIKDEMYGDHTGCVDKYGTTYITTVTKLMAAGELTSNPFEDYAADGGMTVSFDEETNVYTVICTGTIDGYYLSCDGYGFTAGKATNIGVVK